MNQPNDTFKPADAEQGPIHDTELERLVLASLILSYNSVVETNTILTESCFYNPDNREIFNAIKSVCNNGNIPDIILVSSELARNESKINATDIATLCINTNQTFDIVPHALLLKDYSLRRKLWETGYNLITKSSNVSQPTTSLHSSAKEEIDGLYEDIEPNIGTLQSSYKTLQNHIIENVNLKDGETFGTPTGFPELDNNGGLCGSDLIVIGAETSQGKTSFATALALSSIEHGDGVAFYSMEMTSLQLTARIASMKSGISSRDILYKKLTVDDFYKIDDAMSGLDKSLMYFDEKSNSSLESIVTSIRVMKLKHNIKGAVVDYLQLINISDKSMNREQSTAQCARVLKNLAKELDIWVILISQLSRNPQNPIPSRARLRDSGQIEEAADNIFLVYRPRDGKLYPAPFSEISTYNTAMVMVDKGRNIGTSQFICGFKPENTLFYPLQSYTQSGGESLNFTNSDPFQEDAPF